MFRLGLYGLVALLVGATLLVGLWFTMPLFSLTPPEVGDPDHDVTQPVMKVAIPAEPRLGMLFTGWYGFDHGTGEMIGGLGSTHWNDGPDTGGVVHTPYVVPGSIGSDLPQWVGPEFYCSADPIIVAYQIEKMKQTGITVLQYSWWGWGDTDLDGDIEGHPDQWINKSLIEMLTQLRDIGSDIQVAVLIEPFPKTQAGIEPSHLTNSQLQLVLDYLYKNYYSRFPDQIFRWKGHPLVLSYDPMLMIDVGMVNPTTMGNVERNNATGWRPKADVVTIELINPGPNGTLSVEVVNSVDVQVMLATDGNGAITSTANDVVNAVNANADARRLLGAEAVAGSTGEEVVEVASKTHLTSFVSLEAVASAGDNTIVVDDQSIFNVGDHIQITDLANGNPETATIRGLDAGDGPTYRLSLDEPLGLGHDNEALVKKADYRWTHRRESSQLRTAATEAQGWQWWLVPQQPLPMTISEDGMVFANHRFSEYYLHLAQASYLHNYQWRDIEQFFQNGVYENQWQWMLENKPKISIIFVYSWNFYGELAQLEPSTHGPAPPEEEYVEKTRRYYQAFLAGRKSLEVN